MPGGEPFGDGPAVRFGSAGDVGAVPVDDTEAVMTRLRAANVVASVRAGRMRLSAHFYNLEEEIDRVAALMGWRVGGSD